jgi:hypothetical protein
MRQSRDLDLVLQLDFTVLVGRGLFFGRDRVLRCVGGDAASRTRRVHGQAGELSSGRIELSVAGLPER